MEIIYKKVESVEPHCGICGERLGGEGGYKFPYNCSCGYWEFDLDKNSYELKTEDSNFTTP